MKILVSPGYGAGWSTWGGLNKEQEKFMLFYKPIIEWLEAGNDSSVFANQEHPLLVQFMADGVAKFGEGFHPYLGGADDLVVQEVFGPFRITEYDGYEHVETLGNTDWIFGEND